MDDISLCITTKELCHQSYMSWKIVLINLYGYEFVCSI